MYYSVLKTSLPAFLGNTSHSLSIGGIIIWYLNIGIIFILLRTVHSGGDVFRREIFKVFLIIYLVQLFPSGNYERTVDDLVTLDCLIFRQWKHFNQHHLTKIDWLCQIYQIFLYNCLGLSVTSKLQEGNSFEVRYKKVMFDSFPFFVVE